MDVAIVVAIFAVVFPVMWISVTSLLGLMSGWFALQRRFPDREEPPLERLRYCSGMMRGFVNLANCLHLDICPGGLRVSLVRLLGPFQRPFFVPWSEIGVKKRNYLVYSAYRLTFGRENTGKLLLGRRTFDRIAAGGRLKVD